MFMHVIKIMDIEIENPRNREPSSLRLYGELLACSAICAASFALNWKYAQQNPKLSLESAMTTIGSFGAVLSIYFSAINLDMLYKRWRKVEA